MFDVGLRIFELGSPTGGWILGLGIWDLGFITQHSPLGQKKTHILRNHLIFVLSLIKN
jgi:hypothetical protein